MLAVMKMNGSLGVVPFYVFRIPINEIVTNFWQIYYYYSVLSTFSKYICFFIIVL